jgi:hypothetical protein
MLGESLLAQLIAVGAAIGSAGLVYLAIMHLLGIPEARRILALLRRRPLEEPA